MKNHTKFSYLKNLTLLSLVALSSEVRADLASIIIGADSSINLGTITTAITAVQATVDEIDIDNDEILGTAVDSTTTAVTGGIAYTANTNNLSSVSKSLSTIEGASFNASASLAALAGLDVAAGTAIVGGTTYTANTNDLTSVSRALGAIEGANFSNTADTLHNISNNTVTVPLATAANLVNLGSSSDVSSLYTTLSYVIANIQGDPITQVNSAKALAALTTTVTLAGSPAAGTTSALNTYNTSIAAAITAAATATKLATQRNANTATAITAVNTAITNFNTFMTALIADAGYTAATPTVYISSKYGEAQIKWAANQQLLWSLKQLLAQQATA